MVKTKKASNAAVGKELAVELRAMNKELKDVRKAFKQIEKRARMVAKKAHEAVDTREIRALRKKIG